MKRYICLIISLCIILSSFSFCFAVDWSTSDQTNLSNAAARLYYNGYSAAYYLKLIADRTAAISTISSDLSTIKGYLFDDGHSIAYWTSAIASWMSPIYNSLTQTPVDLATIIGALGYYDSNSTYHPYLIGIDDTAIAVTNKYKSIQSWTSAMRLNNAHYQLVGDNGAYGVYYIGTNGTKFVNNKAWYNGTPIGNLAVLLQGITNNQAFGYEYRWTADLTGYNSQQTALNWGNLGNSYFTPSSQTDGIYKWFAALQAPTARLSYVLASDERIAAQEAAALAEQQVVDDFIDPAGDSSATASDFGSISDLSSGYQQNFGSTASVSGIFDIFDSNNFGWFSSETYNQLDTTVAQRGSNFETPLLDQQLEDISRALGVDYAN